MKRLGHWICRVQGCHDGCGSPRGVQAGRGFSLVELMIAVAVIGILASIVLLNSDAFRIKANREAAKAYMLEVVSKQKLYFLDRRAYAASVDILAVPVTEEVAKAYDVDVILNDPGDPPSFVVTATPKPATVQRDDGILSIDHRGKKEGKW